MSEFIDDQLITEVAHDLVEEVAPRELPIFPATSKAFFKNPDDTTRRQWAKEEKLGFGLQEAAVFLTPVILAVTTEVMQFLVETFKVANRKQAVDVMTALIKKVIPGGSKSVEEKKGGYSLSREDLAKFRKLVLTTALKLGVRKSQAKILANAVVGRLSVSD